MNKTPEKYFDVTHALSIASLAVMALVLILGTGSFALVAVAVLFLGIAVMTSVHHAETIAKRVGPSLGALILAVSVTVIEVGLIVALMTNDTPDSATVARDTVFAALVIVTNGIVGFCLLLGGLRHRVLGFQLQGTKSLLAVLAVLAGLTLVLPNYTTSTPGPTYSEGQLVFAAIASLALYFALVLAQTKTQKDYFESHTKAQERELEETHYIPSAKAAWFSFAGLVLSLTVVIGLAKSLSPSIEAGVTAIGAPRVVVGLIIALLVLLPETWAAISAARANELQTSLNLALGSGVASIALTIPVVSVFSILTNRPLTLGLDAKGMAFLVLTFVTCGLTLGTGRSTALQGVVHLVLMCAFIILSTIP